MFLGKKRYGVVMIISIIRLVHDIVSTSQTQSS